MSIFDGQRVRALESNAAWISKNSDDTPAGKYTWANLDVASGATVNNGQQEWNSLCNYTGKTVNAGLSALPGWISTQAGTPSDNLTMRGEALTVKFDPSVGHTHDATPGNGPKISATSLAGVVPISKGGTGATTQQTAINAISGLVNKGDILASDGANDGPLSVGADGTAIVADSTQLTGLAYVPVTRVVKVTLSHTAFQAAALSNDIEAFNTVAKSLVLGSIMKTSVAFAGTGITGYTVSLGTSADFQKYGSNFDVTTAVTDANAQATNAMDVDSFSGATSIRAKAIATGANLNQSTAGSIDIWLLVMGLQ